MGHPVYIHKSIKLVYQKSKNDTPTASIPVIEVFLNKLEKDLFEQTKYKDIEDNLTSEERKALTEFRSVSVEDL